VGWLRVGGAGGQAKRLAGGGKLRRLQPLLQPPEASAPAVTRRRVVLPARPAVTAQVQASMAIMTMRRQRHNGCSTSSTGNSSSSSSHYTMQCVSRAPCCCP
jgi:hypothetical protein